MCPMLCACFLCRAKCDVRAICVICAQCVARVLYAIGAQCYLRAFCVRCAKCVARVLCAICALPNVHIFCVALRENQPF